VAITKDQFIQDAVNEIANYPDLARRFQIGDPLIKMHIAAMAAMLSDLSSQVELTTGEVYLKARDVTVLADAAVKGVLPYGVPCVATITVTNTGTARLNIIAGRVLRDQNGRLWQVTTGAQIAVSATGKIVARQVALRTITHTVAQNQPFYVVTVPEPDIGHIAEVLVEGWEYTPEFCNVQDGDLIYHIQSNEFLELGLVFGVDGLAGKQPDMGLALKISIYDTEGDIDPSVGMAFYFEYGAATEKATMELTEVSQAGEAPMNLTTLREVCTYPGIYSENAVFRSNFDFLVRKHLGAVVFLNVWNELKEEEARGAKVTNMNRLFVSVLKNGVTNTVLETKVRAIIKAADDSYRVNFVKAVEKPISLQLTLYVPSTYDVAAVRQTVREVLLANYGRDSSWAKRGEAKILRKDIYDLLRKNVPALTQRIADITVDSVGSTANDLPEYFRYVTEASLTVLAEGA